MIADKNIEHRLEMSVNTVIRHSQMCSEMRFFFVDKWINKILEMTPPVTHVIKLLFYHHLHYLEVCCREDVAQPWWLTTVILAARRQRSGGSLLKPAQANSSMILYLEKTHHQKWTGAVAQDLGPEFKP
jgi:hypothetical protein